MAEEEIARLQEELKAAIAAEAPEEVQRLRFKKHSPEGDLVSDTIRRVLQQIDKMRIEKQPFVLRVQKAISLFKFIAANPNLIAAHPDLRQTCINKAHEFLEADYSRYNDNASLDLFHRSLRPFITWTEEILPHNVHYKS
jgi:hypothetical protein